MFSSVLCLCAYSSFLGIELSFRNWAISAKNPCPAIFKKAHVVLRSNLTFLLKRHTKKMHSRTDLPILFHESLGPRFRVVLLVALLLLDTFTSSQLIPSPQPFQEPSLRSNTSLSSNDLKVYIVYSFIEGSFPDSRNEKIRLHLSMILAPADAQEYGGDYTGVEFWRVKMNNMQRTALMSAFPTVGLISTMMLSARGPLLMNTKAHIYEDTQLFHHESLARLKDHSQNLSHPDRSLSQISERTELGLGAGAGTIYQTDASSDLRVVSWAPNVPLGKTRSYAYDSQGGGEAVIYIIENGIDGRNPVTPTDTPTSKYYVDIARNSLGRLKSGYTLQALEEQRQTTILAHMDLALRQRPRALKMASLKPPALLLSSPLSTSWT